MAPNRASAPPEGIGDKGADQIAPGNAQARFEAAPTLVGDVVISNDPLLFGPVGAAAPPAVKA